MLFLSSFVLSSILLVASVPIPGPSPPEPTSTTHSDVPHLQSLWAQFAPYTPAEYVKLPTGCTIKQVNLVQRHGSRYPTKNQNAAIEEAVKNVQAVLGKQKDEDIPSKLKFLSPNLPPKIKFEYPFTKQHSDKLTKIGKAESFESGRRLYLRYKDFKLGVPFVHSSSIERVEESAKEWIRGFGDHNIKTPTIIEKKSDKEEIDKVKGEYITPWKKRYLPQISQALSTKHVQLADDDVFGLMFMCPFHTSHVREGVTSSKTLSPFCDIFTIDQFKDFAWQGALDKYYMGKAPEPHIYGLSPSGYTKDLHSRLRSKKQQFYADFSHDNEMAGIMNKLGLFPSEHLPLKRDIKLKSTFLTSKFTPFAAELMTELVACEEEKKISVRTNDAVKRHEYVRVLVNDVVQQLEWCKAKDGLCELDKFLQGPPPEAESHK